MDPSQSLTILVLMQIGFALFAGGIGFLCGYMFCYEKYFTKEEPEATTPGSNEIAMSDQLNSNH